MFILKIQAAKMLCACLFPLFFYSAFLFSFCNRNNVSKYTIGIALHPWHRLPALSNSDAPSVVSHTLVAPAATPNKIASALPSTVYFFSPRSAVNAPSSATKNASCAASRVSRISFSYANVSPSFSAIYGGIYGGVYGGVYGGIYLFQ